MSAATDLAQQLGAPSVVSTPSTGLEALSGLDVYTIAESDSWGGRGMRQKLIFLPSSDGREETADFGLKR